MEKAIFEYVSEAQASRQWKQFLAALAAEFGEQLADADLRAMMQRVGARFAAQLPLPRCDTVPQMQQAMSDLWMSCDWGWVELHENADHLAIRHFCSPLRAAFGEQHLRWTPAFLEGAYQQWFHSMGSGSTLRVQQSTQADAFGCVEFRLAQ